jgi:hypothetical protein
MESELPVGECEEENVARWWRLNSGRSLENILQTESGGMAVMILPAKSPSAAPTQGRPGVCLKLNPHK